MLLMLIALTHLEGRLNRRRRYNLGDLDLIFSQYERELRVLETRGLIKSIGGGRYTYTVFSPILEWWVIKEIENSSDEDELEQRQLVFFNRLSRRQAEQIKQVIRAVWEHKDAIASIADWLKPLLPASL